jgi:hypothetical protein
LIYATFRDVQSSDRIVSGYRNWGDFEHPLLRILPNIRKYARSVRFVIRSALDGSEAND